ncbi:D111/G-patch domain-containing protein [Populus alba x Populus x berolinensis]|uniref:D111/G-patch domain-containing protein n=1 Tax=Populus alba x Populus x berolinensis TaxID=444605 RepID=A0AAD6R7S4_9ROSI|nr:D111/G-patch domain-containing protein [Populus alba x Populus x berolinensis]
MKKLSFSIPSKSKSKSKPKPVSDQPDNDNSKQYLTEFDPSKNLLPQNAQTPIILPIQNDYQPHKKMKNIHLPLHQDDSSTDLRFEVETLSSDPAAASDSISFGLNLRHSATTQTQDARNEDVLLEKLRYDLKRLPEDRGFEEFEEMPVEDFAKALLKGYGWHEGRGVGKNSKEDVQVKQYTKRTDKEGLGFLAVSHDSKNKKQRERSKDGLFLGKEVRVISGKKENLGLKGTVVERLGSDSIALRVEKSGERVKVRVSDVAELGSREEERCLKELKSVEEKKPSDGDREQRRVNKRNVESRESLKMGNGNVGKERGVQWLRSHIRVRIISKDLKGGKLYLKKGEVVDVVGPYKCDISMDASRELVQSVDQDALETALPRRGGPVLVLYGKHKGAYGNLVQRDIDREVGVVQDSGSHELLNVKLEQIAEYVGDPSYIGY